MNELGQTSCPSSANEKSRDLNITCIHVLLQVGYLYIVYPEQMETFVHCTYLGRRWI